MPLHDTPDSIPTKQCRKCKRWLPATVFYFTRHKEIKSGLNPRCKECNGGKYGWRRNAFAATRDGHRVCISCREEKPLTDEFFELEGKRLRHMCRECRGVPKRVFTEIRDGLKLCTKCKRWLPPTTEYFYARKQFKDGLFPSCIDCARAYWIKNRERKSSYRRAYYARNREKLIAYGYQYRNANREHVNAVIRKWAKANKERVVEKNRNYHIRKAAANGTHTIADVRRQYEAQKGKCYYCGCELTDGYHKDHVVPLSRGGSDGPENIVVACGPCNLAKGDKLPHEWDGSNRLL